MFNVVLVLYYIIPHHTSSTQVDSGDILLFFSADPLKLCQVSQEQALAVYVPVLAAKNISKVSCYYHHASGKGLNSQLMNGAWVFPDILLGIQGPKI